MNEKIEELKKELRELEFKIINCRDVNEIDALKEQKRLLLREIGRETFFANERKNR